MCNLFWLFHKTKANARSWNGNDKLIFPPLGKTIAFVVEVVFGVAFVGHRPRGLLIWKSLGMLSPRGNRHRGGACPSCFSGQAGNHLLSASPRCFEGDTFFSNLVKIVQKFIAFLDKPPENEGKRLLE